MYVYVDILIYCFPLVHPIISSFYSTEDPLTSSFNTSADYSVVLMLSLLATDTSDIMLVLFDCCSF